MQRSPHSRAFSFISLTNLRSLPDTCTARAIAASLPDTSISPFSSASSRTRLPFGSTPDARARVAQRRLRDPHPLVGPVSSTTTSAVMILVRLAIGSTVQRPAAVEHLAGVDVEHAAPPRGGLLKRSAERVDAGEPHVGTGAGRARPARAAARRAHRRRAAARGGPRRRPPRLVAGAQAPAGTAQPAGGPRPARAASASGRRSRRGRGGASLPPGRCGERPHHADPSIAEDHQRDHHQRRDPVLDQHRDGEEREQPDQGQAPTRTRSSRVHQ